MLTFYIGAGAMALVTAFILVRPLVITRRGAVGQDSVDAQVFRDQLDEIERDLDRGTISASEAEGARVEISRRLLSAAGRADKAVDLEPAPQGHSGMVAGLALIGAPALAAALYIGLGQPGLRDSPLAERQVAAGAAAGQLPGDHPATDRPGQSEAEARVAGELPPAPEAEDEEYLALVTRLEEMVKTRPDDVEGHRLLANGLMRLGRWSDAWQAYAKVAELMGEGATAAIHAAQAEAMVLAAGGYVSPEAEAAIRRALTIDPLLPMGRYYAGLTLQQAGRLDDAIAVWEALRQDTPADAPYLEWLNMMLAQTIQARDGTSGGTAPGPSQEDMAAAEDMTPDERMEMILGMVERLETRLTSDGGSAEEWGRLMASYATLERMGEAQRVFALALAAYPDGGDHDALIAHAGRLGIEGGATEPAAPAPGPSAKDVAAAQQMSPEDRAEMISGMVARLEDRLVTEGGTAEEWLRLIRSYKQLDRTDDAARIYKLAYAALEQDPSRGFVKEQSLLMGVPVE